MGWGVPGNLSHGVKVLPPQFLGVHGHVCLKESSDHVASQLKLLSGFLLPVEYGRFPDPSQI